MKMTARNPYGSFIKWMLHTPIGACIAFYMGVRGFNRLTPIIGRFQRFYREGESLRKREFLSDMGNGIFGVYVYKRMLPSFNSRVDVGAALTSSLMSGSTLGGISSPLPPNKIALSTSVLTPAKTDTTLTGETSATGLGRTTGSVGTYTAPSTLDGAASYVVSNTFTNSSGGSVTVQSSALFDAASSGNMFVEANLSSSAVLANGDQLIIQWTVNN